MEKGLITLGPRQLYHYCSGHFILQPFDHLTAVSGVGLSPALATCETSQVLLAGVSGGFSRVLPFSPHLLIGPSHMS